MHVGPHLEVLGGSSGRLHPFWESTPIGVKAPFALVRGMTSRGTLRPYKVKQSHPATVSSARVTLSFLGLSSRKPACFSSGRHNMPLAISRAP
jgi:hypothetical protein